MKQILPKIGRNIFYGHPPGLSTLFFTEMWERFSYYGMRAILLLYMVTPLAQGGLDFNMRHAASIYGTYTMGVYMMAIPGGLLADRLIGAQEAVLTGGLIIAIGHFTLAYPSLSLLYLGLFLVALGTGLLKPNVSTLVGSLYQPDDPRRDSGFSLFYLGINVGAMIAPLICGYLAQSEGFRHTLNSWGFNPINSWHWGFAAAGVGMIFGLIHYQLQRPRLKEVGARKTKIRSSHAQIQKQPLTLEEWRSISAILILFLFTVLFWALYEQAGSSLNLFADRLTRTTFFGWSFPSSWFQSLQALFVILLAPLFSLLWTRLGPRQPSSPIKFSFGLFFLGLSFLLLIPASLLSSASKISPLWLFAAYFLQVVGELCLSPVGLSTVTKLAPVKLTGIMMGLWFLAAAFGNKIASYFAGFFNTNSVDLLIAFFGTMSAIVLTGATLLLAVTPVLRKLMGKVQ